LLGVTYQVRELPPKAEVIAWSDKTGIEMFRYGDHIMGIQGHPEYTKDILLHLIDRLLQLDMIMVCPPSDQLSSLGSAIEWSRLLVKSLNILINIHPYIYMQESYAEEVKAKVGALEPDREAWKKLCISFLKGGL